MNGKQLRNSILQWAISGRLVPQDPNDEPAIELLKRINPKAAPITEEVPFTLPDSWCWTTLGEIGKWQSGSTPSRTRSDYYGGNIPWLKTGDLNDGLIEKIPENITQKALEETSVKLNPAGSVLIAMYGATVGKIGILTFPATTNQACCACYQYKVEQMYLFYFLLANRANFIAKGVGGAQPNISKEKIVATHFPLPPLAEQERIVRKVEELLPLVERYDKAQTELDRLNASLKGKLRASVLQEAIAGRLVPQDPSDEPAIALLRRINPKATPITEEVPFDLPDSWCWCRFSQIVKFRIGKTPPRGDAMFWEKGLFNWVSISDMDDCGHITTTKEKVSEHSKKLMGDVSPIGTLIMSFKLTVGRTSILEIPSYHNEAIISIFPYIDKDYSLRNYLFYILPVVSNYGESKDAIKGKTLNSKSISELLIPLPPLAEQERVVQKVEELFAVLDALQ